jgi:predicted RNA-binding protein YlqC (UPF0109 family)
MLLTPFLAHPEDIRVNLGGTTRLTNISASVHKTDQSKVIGAGANMVKALTIILKRAAHIKGESVWFEVLEPSHGLKEPETPFKESNDWSESRDTDLANLMDRVLPLIVNGTSTTHVRSEDGRTHLYLQSEEPIPLVVISALNVVFRAIGKGMGRRTVSIHVGH